MEQKSKKGFAANPKKASEAGKKAKANQTKEERSERSRLASLARWEKQNGIKAV